MIEEVVKFLLSLPYAKTYKDEYIYIRCPICGDSIKHRDKPHCAIWLKPGQPLIYHCWICENSGIVNNAFLKDLHVNDYQVMSAIGKYNKENFGDIKLGSAKFITPSKAKDIIIPKLRDDNVTKRKIDYVRSRLNIEFTPRILEFFRCICSLKDFLKLNGIMPNKMYKKVIRIIENDYVGFLTTDKTTIIFRDITSRHKFRYIRYQVFNGFNLSDTFYCIPTQADPMAPSIDLNITEGMFDILGVFFHVNKAVTDNSIYVAVGGSGYKKVLRYFLNKGFLTNLNLNIYSDADKPIDWYRDMLDDYDIWFKNINIYYNDSSKDFGVPKDKISIRKAVF